MGRLLRAEGELTADDDLRVSQLESLDVVTFRLGEDIEFRLGRESLGRVWANLDGSALTVEQAGLELTVVGEA